MKMEILTVQNQYDVTKGSNWTSTTLAPRSTKQNEEQPAPIDDDDIFRLLSYNDEAIQQISDKLTQTLREAKKTHLLPCTEVLLPCELLHCVSIEMLKKSENEACGIRGCNIIIEFEDERGQKRQIASTKTDPNTVSTFELILELKQDKSGWTTFLPQFLKNLTRGGTVMISRDYVLMKNKLNYSFE